MQSAGATTDVTFCAPTKHGWNANLRLKRTHEKETAQARNSPEQPGEGGCGLRSPERGGTCRRLFPLAPRRVQEGASQGASREARRTITWKTPSP